MKTLIITLLTVAFFSCNSGGEKTADGKTNSSVSSLSIDPDQALRFINSYTEFCTNPNPQKEHRSWIEKNAMLTDHFKRSYKNLLDSAEKADPEYGLGFDPIFDAQDFPEKGFSILTVDTVEGYVTVTGKDWTDFQLVLKLVQKDNQWLVEGAGVINIPESRRAKR